jgi:hypothetical protein
MAKCGSGDCGGGSGDDGSGLEAIDERGEYHTIMSSRFHVH